ncbi:MAG TPA: bifunctional 4-hydroxy-2-oxoglutarate aldolase/2-dehydro-3-deoxy-phosphogluconate aldolase [Propionibacteriaceae bacterium]|nr:bifunctional 4-hydroxy-2-oxoglutarate aldolase/2-dehydro-3-deoxy-phosphogluconate aldolase [Propionibacteriaceae bacterium]
MSDLLKTLAPNPLIAILRAPDADVFAAATQTLYEAGFRCVEFTLTTTGAIQALKEVVASMPDDLVVGIGTVRTENHVTEAIDAGAAFLVSQVFRRPLVDAAARRGVPFFPGALTPTEILDAWESGVPAVKVSPIGPVGGLAYFDNVRGPLPDIPLMPTGGVELNEVSAYLDKGAVAVGLSGALLADALLPGGDLAALARRAEQAVAAVRVR